MPLSEPLLTAQGLTELYPELEAAFSDARALQKSDVRDDFAPVGIGYQWIADRLNAVLGPAHWRMMDSDLQVTETPGGVRALAKVTVEFGNPHYLPEQALSGWEVIAVRTSWGAHAAIDFGDAVKGAVTNGFKKAVALLGPGHQAFAGLLDDDMTRPDEVGLPKTSIPTGFFSVRVQNGKYTTTKDGKGNSTGAFHGRLHAVKQDVIIPVVAYNAEAMLLQSHHRSQEVIEVQVSPEGEETYTVTAVRALEPAVPDIASDDASGEPSESAAKPPIVLDEERIAAAEAKAAQAHIAWPLVRAAYTQQGQFASPDDAARYIDTLSTLTTASSTKLRPKMASKIDTLGKFSQLEQYAIALGMERDAVSDILVSQDPETKVTDLKPQQISAAALELLGKLVALASETAAQAN